MNQSRYFDGKKYYLYQSGVRKTEANFWKNSYLNKGFKVRVIKGTSLDDKNKYYVYRR